MIDEKLTLSLNGNTEFILDVIKIALDLGVVLEDVWTIKKGWFENTYKLKFSGNSYLLNYLEEKIEEKYDVDIIGERK